MEIKVVNPIITDSSKARKYIKQFCDDYKKVSGNQCDYVDTATRRIEFSTMDDKDAIWVANQLQQVTSEAAKQRLTPGE